MQSVQWHRTCRPRRRQPFAGKAMCEPGHEMLSFYFNSTCKALWGIRTLKPCWTDTIFPFMNVIRSTSDISFIEEHHNREVGSG